MRWWVTALVATAAACTSPRGTPTSRTATAAQPREVVVAVTLTGRGGRVRVPATGTVCEDHCVVEATRGTAVVLEATAAFGVGFDRWDGPCEQQARCEFTPQSNTAQRAWFSPRRPRTAWELVLSGDARTSVNAIASGNDLAAVCGNYDEFVHAGGTRLAATATTGFVALVRPSDGALVSLQSIALAGGARFELADCAFTPSGRLVAVGQAVTTVAGQAVPRGAVVTTDAAGAVRGTSIVGDDFTSLSHVASCEAGVAIGGTTRGPIEFSGTATQLAGAQDALIFGYDDEHHEATWGTTVGNASFNRLEHLACSAAGVTAAVWFDGAVSIDGMTWHSSSHANSTLIARIDWAGVATGLSLLRPPATSQIADLVSEDDGTLVIGGTYVGASGLDALPPTPGLWRDGFLHKTTARLGEPTRAWRWGDKATHESIRSIRRVGDGYLAVGTISPPMRLRHAPEQSVVAITAVDANLAPLWQHKYEVESSDARPLIAIQHPQRAVVVTSATRLRPAPPALTVGQFAVTGLVFDQR